MDSRGLSKGTILSNPHAFNNAIAINNAAKSDSNVVEVALIDIIGTQEVMQVLLLFMKHVRDQFNMGSLPTLTDRTLIKFLGT